MSSCNLDSASMQFPELLRNPTDVVPVHMDTLGHTLCFKIVEEADKAPGKCWSHFNGL